MNWLYNDTINDTIIDSIEKFPEGVNSFIYKITRISDGKFYIGKKSLYSHRTKPLTKKELSEQADKRKSKKKKVVLESDWKTYYGSDVELKQEVKSLGGEQYRREILHFCRSKKQATYQELRHQVLNGCLESDNCYNKQILGKIWKSDI
jgi:hypothetical protein